ncbi:hypothetical protein COOONC_28395 [Cooperia oncophora]
MLAKEDTRHVYERFKDAALRIEHLRKQRQESDCRKTDKSQQFKIDENKPTSTKCGKCGKKGHNTEECWSKKSRKEASNSFSATLRGWSCNASTTSTQNIKRSSLVPKHIVKLLCLGLETRGIIDTGSQLTIMPLNFLLKAKEKGVDVDNLCKEIKARKLEVFDASGNQMNFLGCMETEKPEALGVQILISPHPEAEYQTKHVLKDMQEQDCVKNIALHREWLELSWRRLYLKPGQRRDPCEMGTQSRRCKIPVLNNSDEPVVFKQGQTIGEWWQHYLIDPRVTDIKSDMLELAKSFAAEGKDGNSADAPKGKQEVGRIFSGTESTNLRIRRRVCN